MSWNGPRISGFVFRARVGLVSGSGRARVGLGSGSCRAWVGLRLSELGLGIIAEDIGKIVALSVIKPAGFGANWARATSGFWLM